MTLREAGWFFIGTYAGFLISIFVQEIWKVREWWKCDCTKAEQGIDTDPPP